MKLLVTGGLGFIGSNFCRYILTTHPDYELVNIDKIDIGSNPANLREFDDFKRSQFIKCNICSPHSKNFQNRYKLNNSYVINRAFFPCQKTPRFSTQYFKSTTNLGESAPSNR